MIHIYKLKLIFYVITKWLLSRHTTKSQNIVHCYTILLSTYKNKDILAISQLYKKRNTS